MTAFVTAAISAIALLAAALVTAFVGPAWKMRRDRRLEAEAVVAQYSRPPMQAAYELQSRIYNIARLNFFSPRSLSDPYRRSYAETSTLWLISQYLGWVEILRREVQFLDLGDIRKTRLLRDRLLGVADSLATDRFSEQRFQVYRSDQRAIGEQMIVRRRGDKGARSDCRGYGEFVDALRDPAFDAWFKQVRRSIVDTIGDRHLPARMVFMPRALIDLIDVLDPNRTAFPNTDERGKLPRPSGFSEPTKARSFEHLASFYNDQGWDPFDQWVAENHLEANKDPWKRPVSSSPRKMAARLVLVAKQGDTSLTLSGWAEPPAWTRATHFVPERLPLTRGGWWFVRSRERGRRLADDLLERYDRPLLL
jgi:hypothetical protein